MSFASRVSTTFRRINENRRAVNELRRMSDRELTDIGISRAQIRSAVRGYN